MKKILMHIPMLLLALALLSAAALAEETEEFDVTRECWMHVRSVPEDFVYQVQHDEPLGDEAFEDALIIGDSITLSLYDYDVIPTLAVEGHIGQSPVAAHMIRNMRYEGDEVSMYELAERMQPGKLLVMLGANGLDYSLRTKVQDDYHALLHDLMWSLRDTDIYLLAVTPVRPGVQKSKDAPVLTLEKIRLFNEWLRELAISHGVRYIDIYTPLLGEDGASLKLEYATPDGIHLTMPGAYQLGDAIRKGVMP